MLGDLAEIHTKLMERVVWHGDVEMMCICTKHRCGRFKIGLSNRYISHSKQEIFRATKSQHE